MQWQKAWIVRQWGSGGGHTGAQRDIVRGRGMILTGIESEFMFDDNDKARTFVYENAGTMFGSTVGLRIMMRRAEPV